LAYNASVQVVNTHTHTHTHAIVTKWYNLVQPNGSEAAFTLTGTGPGIHARV